jgi:hypothetical protein
MNCVFRLTSVNDYGVTDSPQCPAFSSIRPCRRVRLPTPGPFLRQTVVFSFPTVARARFELFLVLVVGDSAPRTASWVVKR